MTTNHELKLVTNPVFFEKQRGHLSYETSKRMAEEDFIYVNTEVDSPRLAEPEFDVADEDITMQSSGTSSREAGAEEKEDQLMNQTVPFEGETEQTDKTPEGEPQPENEKSPEIPPISSNKYESIDPIPAEEDGDNRENGHETSKEDPPITK